MRFGVSVDLPLVAGYQAHKAASAHDSVFYGALADIAPDAWGAERHRPRPRQAPPRRPQLTALDYVLAAEPVTSDTGRPAA